MWIDPYMSALYVGQCAQYCGLSMPRCSCDVYADTPARFAAVFQSIGILLFVYNLVRSYFKGQIAGADPWDAWTLEWSTASPPPSYNFAVIPSVESRRPLWDLKHPEDADGQYE